jgi:prepilin-type N-terminal cleavage/methylation domain-containing protein
MVSLGRAGVTLIELLVVLALLGLMASLVAVSWVPPSQVVNTNSQLDLVTARRTALREGHPVKIVIEVRGQRHPIVAMPDGRILGAESAGINPLTGRTYAADAIH